MSRPELLAEQLHRDLYLVSNITCQMHKDGIKNEPIFNINSTMRKALIKEVGDGAAILFWHIATRRSTKTSALTDENLAIELGGADAKWTVRKVKNQRGKLIKSHWFYVDVISDRSKKAKHIHYYIGKLAVIKFKTGSSDLPYWANKLIDLVVMGRLGCTNAVECSADFIPEKLAIQSDIASWLLQGKNIKDHEVIIKGNELKNNQ